MIVTKTATGRGKARREGGKSGEGQTRMALPTRSGFGAYNQSENPEGF